ncbi:hypothetical protein Tco_1525329 [Tanacetum coccineum]
MDITRAEQIALDDALVAPANRLKIGKSNFRLSSDLKSKEATLQVVYDVLKLTPFYKAFQITTDVLEIYMQEFWATVTVHHHSIRFKMNNKKHIVNLKYFREMLQISPKLPNQQFKELPFEEAILTFLRDLGHSGEIKMITDVNVNKLHQPWRSFAAVINKCLSGKSTGYDSLRLSQAQIIWGMYHKKNVDYAYLMWEDFVYQVENKNVKKSNEMYYPRFTKVIVNFFMTKDQHEDTQLYGVIFPNELTNEDIRNSESYKEYYAIASGAEPPKTKARVKKKQVRSDKTKTLPTTKGKRLKSSAKAAKPAKKKQPAKTSKAKGLTVLSEVALTEAEQINLATKRSLIQTHSSQASGSGADEGTGSIPGVLDVPTYESDDEQISENPDDVDKDDKDDYADNQDDENTNDANQDDDDEQTESDNDSDDFEIDEEATHEEDEANELYRDVNVNLEGRDTEMTNAPLPNVQGTQVTEDTHVIITAPFNYEGIDSIFTLNTEATLLVDVPVTTIVEPPLLFASTLPPPPTPLITHQQQTLIPTPPTVPSSSLQYLPNFGSLFGFDHRLKTLENNFSKFNQMNQFAAAVSLTPGIVDAYLANKIHEAVKTAVRLQSERLRDEAQAENAYFFNKLDDNIKKIIKYQVKEQVKAQVSKILPKIKKTVNEQLEAEMENNKSIHISDEQRNLHKALVNAYESDKLILYTYRDTVSFKRRKDAEDKDEEPSAGSNRGSKRRRAGKEPESTIAPKENISKTTSKSTEGSKSHYKSAGESAHAEELMHTAKDLEKPAHQEFKTGVTDDQPNEETSRLPNWFQKPTKPPTPDRD